MALALPNTIYADEVQIHAAVMIEPIQARVFHIVIETKDTDKVSNIYGKLSGARITNIWVWQIENNNNTGNCEIRLYEFSCSLTVDKDMPGEITIAYAATPTIQGCYYKPTQLSVEYEEETYIKENAILPIEEYCLMLPMLKG